MFSCKDISEHAGGYLDRKMSLFDRLQFRVHLFICENCRRYVNQLRISVQALKGFRPRVNREAVAAQVAAIRAAQVKATPPNPPDG